MVNFARTCSSLFIISLVVAVRCDDDHSFLEGTGSIKGSLPIPVDSLPGAGKESDSKTSESTEEPVELIVPPTAKECPDCVALPDLAGPQHSGETQFIRGHHGEGDPGDDIFVLHLGPTDVLGNALPEGDILGFPDWIAFWTPERPQILGAEKSKGRKKKTETENEKSQKGRKLKTYI